MGLMERVLRAFLKFKQYKVFSFMRAEEFGTRPKVDRSLSRYHL